MLGARSRVVIEKPRNSRDRTGKLHKFDIGHLIDTKTAQQRENRVFLLGYEDTFATVKARVIGILENESEEIYIAAPVNVCFYEPDIRHIISQYMDLTDWKLTCHYEKSCGAVVYRHHSGNIEFLIIKNKKGNNWGFPKGHVEFGENEAQTAKREVLEETGLEIKLIDGFRVVSEYHPRGKITKQVVFFLAEMPDSEIRLQESEVDRFIWADFGLAQKTFRFNNDRNVLTRARNWLSGRR